jgi:hypothetical protein
MPSSAARRRTAADSRPERIAVATPAECSIFTPWPSRMLNALNASPEAPM